MAFRGNTNREQLGDAFERELFEFIKTNYPNELLDILKDFREKTNYSICANFVQLNDTCPRSTNELLRHPDVVLAAGDKAAYRAQLSVYSLNEKQDELKIKTNVYFRVHSIPGVGLDRYMISFPGSDEAGTFMALVGTVVKITKTGMIEFKKDYVCSKCKQVTSKTAARSRYYRLPKRVDQCEVNFCQKSKVEECKPGPDGITSSDAHRFKDYQEIKIQEQYALNDTSMVPKTMWIVLQDDLVNSCKPGDDVVITGTLYSRYKELRQNQPIEVNLAFMANHVEISNDQQQYVRLDAQMEQFFKSFWKHYENNPFAGRNVIIGSFCPQIFEMYLIKLAINLALVGGMAREEIDTRTRGESHLLLVGDPGTSKSQFLKYVCKLIPRSVFTTGSGTTSAGLTVAAVKENDSWTLEAGALMLADKGVCCIDEFGNISEHDQVTIHEAMEQQTISIAKAGMVSKLETKCTIIAATNPKPMKSSKHAQDLDVDTGLSSPLLSRFDLVFVLKDTGDEAWDNLLCDFIVGTDNAANSKAAIKTSIANGTVWDEDTLRSYLVFLKGRKVVMTEDAQKVISFYYQLQRQSPNRNVARTTLRLFESLCRLSEGHARLMFRKSVLVHDAVVAISLVETSLESAALLSNLPNPLYVGFPEDSLREYYVQAKTILEMLDLPILWDMEKKYLDDLLNRQRTNTSNPPPPNPSQIANTNVSSNDASWGDLGSFFGSDGNDDN